MTIFWKLKTPTWAPYRDNLEYLPEPSVDLIDHFKLQIVEIEEPSECEDYVPCTHVEKSQGHMLFILGSRVEVVVMPDFEKRIIYFINCQDVYSF